MTKTGWTPRKPIRAHGVNYRVKFVNAKKDADLEYGKWDGICLPAEQLIKIDRAADDARKREILLHELIHISDQATSENPMSETRVGANARFLVGTFRDNPGLASYIAGDGDP